MDKTTPKVPESYSFCPCRNMIFGSVKLIGVQVKVILWENNKLYFRLERTSNKACPGISGECRFKNSEGDPSKLIIGCSLFGVIPVK